MPRRKARAIAISAASDAQRKVFAMKLLGALALGMGLLDAVWTVHNLVLAR